MYPPSSPLSHFLTQAKTKTVIYKNYTSQQIVAPLSLSLSPCVCVYMRLNSLYPLSPPIHI